MATMGSRMTRRRARKPLRSPHEAIYARWSGVAARHKRRELGGIAAAGAAGAVLAWCAANGLTLYAFAAIYALIFCMFAWRYPGAALALLFASSVFQSDLSGGGPARFSPAEVHLTLLVPVLLLRVFHERKLPNGGLVFWPSALYLLVCLVSYVRFGMGHGDLAKDGIISMLQMVLYFFVAVGVYGTLPRRAEELLRCLWALSFVGVFLGLTGVATHFSFLGGNKNGIGASLACSLIVTAELWLRETRRGHRLLLSGALLVLASCLFASLSRGAMLGALGGLLLLGVLRREWGMMLRIALLMLPVFTIGWLLMPPETRSYFTGFGKDRYNIQMRYYSVMIAQYYYHRQPLLGVSVGLRKEYDATNLMWLLLAETGIAGLVTFGLIHVMFFHAVWKARRLVHKADPLASLLAVGAALLLYKLLHGMVDHYWSRGAVTLAWAGCGMSVWALTEVRRREALARAAARDPWWLWTQNVAPVVERPSRPPRRLPRPAPTPALEPSSVAGSVSAGIAGEGAGALL